MVKKVDEKKLREFKAEAIRRGLTLSRALEEAIELWLSQKPAWTEPDANNAAYAREKQKLLKEHRGKYAVFARGQLIGVHASLNEVIAALRKLEERPRHALVAKIGEDVAEVLEWWGGSTSLWAASH
ncbi:MAG: hypothetical protein QXT28_10260 [Thermofilaceae archaeon]